MVTRSGEQVEARIGEGSAAAANQPDWGSPKERYADARRMAAADSPKATDALPQTATDALPQTATDALPQTAINHRDMKADFDLGVQPTDWAKMRQTNPQIWNGTMETFLNASPGQSRAGEYARNAMGQMVEKFGAGRFAETMDVLNATSPTPADHPTLKTHRMDFWTKGDLMGGEPRDLNRALYNMADLMEPGRLEQYKQVMQSLRSEGYTKALSLKQSDPQFIDLLAKDPAERKALIEFEQPKSDQDHSEKLRFMGEHPEFMDYSDHRPSQVLAAFKAWQSK